MRAHFLQNYNFDNLNDKEFEVLVNDLISSKEAVQVDRFKPGKDAGVDGRYFVAKEQEVIIQSKHWHKSGIAALMRRLTKDEAQKVKLINPKRYIFATSLPLSRADKSKIKNIFSPYITSENDVLGKDNLNDLLAQHPDVEKKHYKLWLSSSSVLDAMLNSALTGRSEAKRDQIIDATKMYVVTGNHSSAIAKLEELHSVVITGEGGIGKTTLADQLAHHYVGKGYELCVIEDELSEAEAVFTKSRKQVFYFDDFLGRNYLMAIEGRTDSRVLNFMDRVETDQSKRFILTSRSTVLKQGKFHSDLLGIKKVDKKEYEITISSLSILDRARILYNHIWNSGLSNEHIEQLYIDRRYAKITQHDNFNPRLISFITDPDRVRDVSIGDYWAYIVDKLDNPEDVWAHVFDKQIDELTRVAVCLVVYNGTSVAESELRSAFTHRVLSDRLATASNAVFHFTSMIKVAVGSLLQRTISSTSKGPQINLFNPSVADFVLRRHNHDCATLSAFFVSLNTESSLVNLKSLRESSSLSNKLYYKILSTLHAEKINKKFSKENPKYFTRLLQMILTDSEAFELCGANDIVAQVARILPLHDFSNQIEFACDIFEKVASTGASGDIKSARDFIRTYAAEATRPNQFRKLSELRSVLSDDDTEVDRELLRVLHDEAISFWMEQVFELVEHEGILEDYLSDDEDSEAYDSVWSFVEDNLEPFDVKAEKITEIVATVDFDYIKDCNRDARMNLEYDQTEPSSSNDAASGDDIDAQVDDLFERD